jgi:hypothetical protein
MAVNQIGLEEKDLTNMDNKPEEILKENLKTKKVYFCNVDGNIEVKSREVFNTRKKEIRFPFSSKGVQKYKSINAIVFEDILPTELKGLLGYSSGYGFTSNMTPLVSFVDEHFPETEKIIISKNTKTKIDKKRKAFKINSEQYKELFEKIRPIRITQSKDIKSLVNNFFVRNTGLRIKPIQDEYSKGSLASYLNRLNYSKAILSDEDVSTLTEFARDVFNESGLLKARKDIILKTKMDWDEIYIDSVLKQYDYYLLQKTDSKFLEAKWQDFFKQNSWIFSLLFAHSMVLFQDQAYVGGQKIDRRGARYADYIYKNGLSDNVAIIEIKTHLTPLLGPVYRESSGVYPISRQLSGAVGQVADQKDVLLKEWHNVTKENFIPFEPKCFVVIGKLKALNKDEQMKSFELFRNNLRNIEIVTFDELKNKTEVLLNLLRNKEDKN